MPRQNRVTPFGEITVAPWRGALMGNRGSIHDEHGGLGARRWRHQNWVCCVTEFKGRERHPMPPGRWTALFFWDEAVALAAGHRPCGQCRYHAYNRFMSAWQAAGLPGGPDRGGPRLVDKHLHANRVTRTRQQVRFDARASDLPDGTFISVAETRHCPMLIWQGRLWHLDLEAGRYLDAGPLPNEDVAVLTPRPVVEVLCAGYQPDVAKQVG